MYHLVRSGSSGAGANNPSPKDSAHQEMLYKASDLDGFIRIVKAKGKVIAVLN
jgi:hypothetical protein